MQTFTNPFFYGEPVPPDKFIGRELQLRKFFGRLAKGNSVAIIGQPNIGKTSLILYILEEKMQENIHHKFGYCFDKDVFSYLDAQMLHTVKKKSKFWKLALKPLKKLINAHKLKDVKKAYKIARAKQYEGDKLEKLFKEIYKCGFRLILILDEFDEFSTHRILNNKNFYGNLRSLASRLQGLVLIIVARQNLEQIDQRMREKNLCEGSPFCNIFHLIKLGAFSEQAMSDLLKLAGDRFNQFDKNYINDVSGGCPYLVQVTAAQLWEAKVEDKYGVDCYAEAGYSLYDQTKHHFDDTWNSYTNAMRIVITAIALVQIPRLLKKHQFRVKDIIENFDDYNAELTTMKKSGLLVKENSEEWNIRQGVFLWWLADELRRNIRKEPDFQSWLQNQHMDGLLTNEQREKMGNAAKKTMQVIGKGATTLIEVFAQGIGKGFSG